MKRFLIIAAAAALLLPTSLLAQPDSKPDNRPGHGSHGPGGPGKPGGAVTLPGKPPNSGPGNGGRPGHAGPGGVTRPPHRPPSARPPSRPNRPQFSWRGRHFNPVGGSLFRYPAGYGYHRWSVGAFLPSLFLSSLYYYDNWRTLGIDPPPPGRRWVRYGPDLLLVNTRTRRVEDVVYGVFY